MSEIRFCNTRNAEKPKVPEKWATKEEMAALGTEDITDSIILAADASIAFESDGKDFAYQRNTNVVLSGGSGSGKTRDVIIPNLITHKTNYVITDTKGELEKATADGLRKDGYDVATLNTIELDKSAHFNPLAYIMDESEIEPVAKMITDTVDPGRNKQGTRRDPFWDQSGDMSVTSIIGLLYVLEKERGSLQGPGPHKAGGHREFLTFRNVFRLLNLVVVGNNDTGTEGSPLDRVFEDFAAGRIPGVFGEGDDYIGPQYHSVAVDNYNMFKIAADKTLKSILITINASLHKLRTPQMLELLSDDDLRFDEIDEGKRAIFLRMSDNDDSNSFLGNMAFKLLLNRSIKKADANPNGKLSRRVMFVCDEFANIGRIPDFERAISITRSRRMSFLLCVQSISQFDGVYGEHLREIVLDNCDSLIFMGSGSSPATAEYVSKLCGDFELATQRVGVEGIKAGVNAKVITPSDVTQIPRTKCIVKVSGTKPFLTDKYNVLQHPNADKFLKLE